MQLSFNFTSENRYLSEEYFVSKSNMTAFNFVNNYDLKNDILPKIFAICGPTYSGKTHLSCIWHKQTGAKFINITGLKNLNLASYIKPGQPYIIENIDMMRQHKILLEVFNLATEQNSYLLLTSKTNLNNLKYRFADLSSRIKNTFCLNINPPDSELTKMLLLKNFSSRQLAVEPNVIDYIAGNIERSFLAIDHITKLLEFLCFNEQRNITIPLASKALKEKNNQDFLNLENSDDLMSDLVDPTSN